MPEYISKGGEWVLYQSTPPVVEEKIKEVEKVEEKPVTISKPKGRKLRQK